LCAELILPPSTFEHTDEHAEFGVFPSFLQDVMVLPPLVIQQRLEYIFLFDENLHLMSILAELLDGVLVEIEMGRMPHVH
jgi:hypothetical protein